MKVAVFRGNELVQLEISDNATPENFALIASRYPAEHGIISSVSADATEFTSATNNIFWIVATAGMPTPLNNAYATPHTLGIDRLAGAVAAVSHFPATNILVIDAGTAVTFDFTDHEGTYRGGSISPGLNTRLKSLHTFTGRLPMVHPQPINYLIGNTTEESILSGVINGLRCEIDGIIDEYQLLYPDLKVILTGGDAKYFEKTLKNNIFAIPNLVLAGLKLILDYNFEK